MCVCCIYVFECFPFLFNETFLLMVIFATVQTRNAGESIVAAPDPFTKFVFFYMVFALKISAAFTTRSLVEQLLQILFVFLSCVYRKLHLFFVTTIFVSIYLHLFLLYGEERKFRTISSLLFFLVEEFNTPQCNTHHSHSPLLIRDRLISIATVVLFCCYCCNPYKLNC